MSEPATEDGLRIDDLSFTGLLRIALGDVPSASQGRWTLHGPVDPGITLLELFAWELEQRLFMAEQATDGMVRASLRLLGVPDPLATSPARTILCLSAPRRRWGSRRPGCLPGPCWSSTATSADASSAPTGP